ncbi:MAG: alpha/beta fold hydrolase [Vicinamibacterales bacterium]
MKRVLSPDWQLSRRTMLSTIPALVGLAGCRSATRSLVQAVPSRQAPDGFEALQEYCGVYRAGPDATMGIDRFINDGGDGVLLWTDHGTGAVRRMFEEAPDTYATGPAFNTRDPLQRMFRFQRDDRGRLVGVVAQPIAGAGIEIPKDDTRDVAITFSQGDAMLQGTLILPEGVGPHPAILLLHGSGPLTRYSFGPYPRFFSALGFAVLVFDKRGTGASTGWRVDASTGAPDELSPAFYPDDLLADALAAEALLRSRSDIDGQRIGFWGSSEGGMLATQVPAHSADVAFAINSSGFMGPLWQTLLYQAEINLRATGHPEREIEEALAFNRFALSVARTGDGYQAFLARRDELVRTGREDWLTWYLDEYTSLAQMRWSWDHVLAFDPLATLRDVSCPVLGVFGQFDQSTDASVAPVAMRDALVAGGNPNVTVRVIPSASHSLMEKHGFGEPNGSRLAPGVLVLLREWLARAV